MLISISQADGTTRMQLLPFITSITMDEAICDTQAEIKKILHTKETLASVVVTMQLNDLKRGVIREVNAELNRRLVDATNLQDALLNMVI